MCLPGPKVGSTGRGSGCRSARQGRIATALINLGVPERAWTLLRRPGDPSARTELIHDLAAYRVDPRIIIEQLGQDARPWLAVLCSWRGEYPLDRMPTAQLGALVETLLAWYRDDADSGIHGAVGWLLRRWGHARALERIDQKLASQGPPNNRTRYVNRQGQTFAVIRQPEPFLIGSPDDEPARDSDEFQHLVKIPRSYAIATREVTVAELKRFAKKEPILRSGGWDDEVKTYLASPQCPEVSVHWVAAALYCNLLNQAEGVPEKEWCYPKDFSVDRSTTSDSLKELAPTLILSVEQLKRLGYRLPTEAEWEYACRARATTVRPFGRSESRLSKYAWSLDGTRGRLSAGQLKPNDLGLFDMLGNRWNGVQDPYARHQTENVDRATLEGDRHIVTLDGENYPQQVQAARKLNGFMRVRKGGGFQDTAAGTRPASALPPAHRFDIGFRVARTIECSEKER